MGNLTGRLTGSLLGGLCGRRGAAVGGLLGGVVGLAVELGHLVAQGIRARGRHSIAPEAAVRQSWEIVDVGIRYCPLNVAPGPLNMIVDVLRHVLAPFGSVRSGVFRHDWVSATVRSPEGEVAYLVAKKCGDGNIVVTCCDSIDEADEAGIDVIKGCKRGLAAAWQRRTAGRGRSVQEFIRQVLAMRPDYNMIVENCQDFARGMLSWHNRGAVPRPAPLAHSS
eukprot:evm.model.scf_1998.1 EVM.evm.TU.scf_1998.1   scf_1998:15038-16774(+)